MIIDGHCSDEDDFKFKVTNETKSFIISFFGFYHHHLRDDFHSFLESLEVQEIIGSSFDDTLMDCDFSLDGDFGYECYDCCDRRTFDVGIVLQKTFESEKSANEWFNEKIKESEDIRKKDICEILIIDADKFTKYLDESIEEDNKYETISEVIDDKMIEITEAYNNSVMKLKKELLITFDSDEDIVERLIKDVLKV